ncbi:four-carbon acid sugar kinase family protein [Desertivirga brevis]|uniref:four-carbon acid sugar kinase family protein n=1 Tax=Desertivirga brevis TaxID=2810310 RepID=UPI001A95CB2D|nr:four-carbon acid sugar kinase family protein [Pedobacter sp. SYSU D00873]
MIVVIADDLTGAVELAGIGLSYGLKVEVSLDLTASVQSDLLVIATDTRSKTQELAVEDVKSVSRNLSTLNHSFVFKKVDSVLRGHVISELRAQMEVFNLKKALLVPANPGLGRTIENGKYLIHGKPLHETGFANDPEFPARTSEIINMLRTSASDVYIRKPTDSIEDIGISVGETVSPADIDKWTVKVDSETLLAGGSAFFASLLKKVQTEYPIETKQGYRPGTRKLFVSGTAYKDSAIKIQQLSESGQVSYMPSSLYFESISDYAVEQWAAEIENKLNIYQTAIIAIHPECETFAGIGAPELRERTASVVKSIFERTQIDELMVEGGSTAFSILTKLGISRLYPVNEFSTGVVCSRTKEINNLYITLKPGSYQWPEEVRML